MRLATDVSLDDYARRSVGWSGAQLSSVCREAGLLALREDLGATLACARHFDQAWRRVHGAVTLDPGAVPLGSAPDVGQLAEQLRGTNLAAGAEADCAVNRLER